MFYLCMESLKTVKSTREHATQTQATCALLYFVQAGHLGAGVELSLNAMCQVHWGQRACISIVSGIRNALELT